MRKLHNTELHALHSSPDTIRNIKSRRLRWAGHVARMDESRNAYRVLVGRPEGKRPLGRPRRRWEDNIKMDLREVGYDGRDWINLAQGRDQWRAYTSGSQGVLITQENTADADMRQTIARGNRCLRALNKTLRARCISKKAKLTLYKTVVRPIVLYGSETWTLSKKMEQQLMTWERKILRKIYGPKYENGHWRIRYNTELKTQYKSPDIVAEIKARRLEWLGHVIRMNDQRIPKKILNTKPEGRRNIGRQKLRWLDRVEEDLRTLGVRRWRQKALVGQEWTKILREAKARLQGP
ncbi:hypothetical protein ANN_08298 [Periplaneta americana]|uniref:Endonuclease-reverse transcriptase n=1 Tax=Periplaneta americana TaxID=6978 RepID=A0ABQ8T396_PERAM|nr:hypothetical protein ANN_08298 [Periplaneta americana]